VHIFRPRVCCRSSQTIAEGARLLAVYWITFILVFFTFSTTQECFSMPCYPALALLIGSAMVNEGKLIRVGKRAFSVLSFIAGFT
jgi:hypothetical protein